MSERKRSRRARSKALRVEAHVGASVGLPPPGSALTQLPEALRPRSGVIRIKPSDSPYAARSDRRGDRARVVALLLTVRTLARHGRSLIDIVSTGELDGWRAREALSNACGESLLQWDSYSHRTQADRMALVERALGLYGYVSKRRGGWAVSQ